MTLVPARLAANLEKSAGFRARWILGRGILPRARVPGNPLRGSFRACCGDRSGNPLASQRRRLPME
jgi:hypothetical protein